MSILDTINANTEQVRNGKNNVASAIASKGGSVISSGTVPTFNELVAGVNSIDTSGGGSGGGGGEIIVETVVSAGNGAVNMTTVAAEHISKYDSIKVVAGSGSAEYNGYNILPITARIDKTDGTYTTETLAYTQCTQGMSPTVNVRSGAHSFYHSDDNSIICVGSSTTVANYFPFIYKDGVYQQLTINGAYRAFPEKYASGTLSGSLLTTSYPQSIAAYDSSTNILFIGGKFLTAYKLEGDNLVPLASTAQSTYVALWAKNGNVFYNTSTSTSSASSYVRVFDTETNTFGTYTNIWANGFSYAHFLHHIYEISDTMFYAITIQNPLQSLSCYISKFELVDGKYTQKVAVTSAGVGSWPNAITLMDRSKILGVDSNGVVYYTFTDSGTKITVTKQSDYSPLFLDDSSVFDPSTITRFSVDKSGYAVAVNGTGKYLLKTDYDEYGNGNMLGFRTLARIDTDFSPTMSGTPFGTRINHNFANGYYFFNEDGNKLLLYKAAAGGAYLIYKTGNKLSNEDGLYGIGIAKEDIMAGKEGEVSLGVLK